VPSAPRLPGGARGNVEAGWGHPALPVPGGLVKIALAEPNLFDFCLLRDGELLACQPPSGCQERAQEELVGAGRTLPELLRPGWGSAARRDRTSLSVSPCRPAQLAQPENLI